MKLEPIFYAEQNKLYRVSDSTEYDCLRLSRIEVRWSDVELAEDSYNEEFLAKLREQLKALEAQGEFAVLVPVADKPLSSPQDFERFTAAFSHAARRVKDCVSVAGLELPPQLVEKGLAEGSPASVFMETLAVKHAQYVYFARTNGPLPGNIVRY